MSRYIRECAIHFMMVGIIGFPLTSCSRSSNTDPIDRISTCPYGHRTLKRVKLVYSGWSEPDAETLVAIGNHDVTLVRTDVFGESSPNHTIYCTTCGFIYQDGHGPWTKEADDTSAFAQPFSSLVRDFPIPNNGILNKVRYTQDVRDGIISSERVCFKATESLISLKDSVLKWAKQHKLSLRPEALPQVTAYCLYPSGPLLTEQYQYWGNDSGAAMSGHVGFISYPEEKAVMVDLLITLNHTTTRSIDECLP